MAVKHIITRGYGLGGTRFIPTRGYTASEVILLLALRMSPSAEPKYDMSSSATPKYRLSPDVQPKYRFTMTVEPS